MKLACSLAESYVTRPLSGSANEHASSFLDYNILTLNVSTYHYYFILIFFLIFLFRAIAASAPIWQFTGLTPCGDFNRIVTADFNVTYDGKDETCAEVIRQSWKDLDNVTSNGKFVG